MKLNQISDRHAVDAADCSSPHAPGRAAEPGAEDAGDRGAVGAGELGVEGGSFKEIERGVAGGDGFAFKHASRMEQNHTRAKRKCHCQQNQ